MGELIERVVRWVGEQAGRPAELESAGTPEGTGMSSETVLLTLRWPDGVADRYVLRLPPPADAFPLFPSYDLGRQATAMRLVAERSEVPVPRIAWFEPTGAVVGSPFMVMARAGGRAVSDVPPYVFGGWVVDATPDERAQMTRSMVDVLAGIHAVEPAPALELDAPGDTPLRRHVANQRAYYDWIRQGRRFPVVERAFAWLEERWPDEGPAALSWGDARLANVLWDGFRPDAVLDWEAVAVGPRELDLGWLLHFAGYFQRIAERYGYPGVPDLLRIDDVVAIYERATGCAVRDLEWYLVYAELRQALTSIRVTTRAVHLGERAAPDELEELIMDRDHLAEAVGA